MAKQPKMVGSVVRKELFSTPILGTRQPRLLTTISSAAMADKALIFHRKGMFCGGCGIAQLAGGGPYFECRYQASNLQSLQMGDGAGLRRGEHITNIGQRRVGAAVFRRGMGGWFAVPTEAGFVYSRTLYRLSLDIAHIPMAYGRYVTVVPGDRDRSRPRRDRDRAHAACRSWPSP